MFETDVDCLTNGAPHGAEAQALCAFFTSLAPGPELDFIRCYTAFDLYHRAELLQEDIRFTVEAYKELLRDTLELAKRLVERQGLYQHKLSVFEQPPDADSDHYGHLFTEFDDTYYYEHSKVLLKDRYFDRNGLTIPSIERKVALDGGCGGGRYTLVLKHMGFRRVFGIDLSALNVQTAKNKRDARNVQDVVYEQGDVLDLPYADASFDFVLSNGVLHHTPSIPRGLAEIRRVLRPGGRLLLYLMERPGGVMLDTIELLRVVMKPVRRSFARQAMSVLGASGHRVYTLLDHTHVAINTRSTREEVEAMLRTAGFADFHRLKRGLPYDKVEKLLRLDPLDGDAIWKYGVGENRYVCQ
jgi:ubiquinone/menaquinone biosynthesis C-methylase UbiE